MYESIFSFENKERVLTEKNTPFHPKTDEISPKGIINLAFRPEAKFRSDFELTLHTDKKNRHGGAYSRMPRIVTEYLTLS